MADVGLAAFRVVLMQSPSFLAQQAALAEGVGRGRAGPTRTRCAGCRRSPVINNDIRSMLDRAPSDHVNLVFAAMAGDLGARG